MHYGDLSFNHANIHAISPMIYLLDIPRIFLERMHFLWLNVMFYDAVNVIHDVITTADPFPYIPTATSILSELEIIKLNKSDVER